DSLARHFIKPLCDKGFRSRVTQGHARAEPRKWLHTHVIPTGCYGPDVAPSTSKPRLSRARVRQRHAASAGRPALWEGRFSFVDALAPGGRRWLSVYGQSRAEVESKLADAMASKSKGITPPRGALTVGQFLTAWLEQGEPDLKPSTAARYRGLIEQHIVPRIGSERLTRLTPTQVNAMTAAMIAAGQNAHSANRARAVLRTALNDAVRQGFLVRNAAALADPRRVEERVVEPMEPEEARTIIDAFDGHPLH